MPEKEHAMRCMRRQLLVVLVSSVVIALLVGSTSVIGWLYQSQLYSDALQSSFATTDILNLVIGVPLLLISIGLVWRARLLGLVFLPGALFYLLYIYVPYLLAVPFGILFPIYLAIVTLATYSLVALAVGMDAQGMRERLRVRVPVRVSAGILAGLAILILVRQLALVGTALVNQSNVSPQELALWIDDLAVAFPLLLLVGLQLWRREAFGYAFGGGLLLAYALLSLGVIPLLLSESRAASTPPDIGGIIVLAVMAVLCLVPFTFFVRASFDKGELPNA